MVTFIWKSSFGKSLQLGQRHVTVIVPSSRGLPITDLRRVRGVPQKLFLAIYDCLSFKQNTLQKASSEHFFRPSTSRIFPSLKKPSAFLTKSILPFLTWYSLCGSSRVAMANLKTVTLNPDKEAADYDARALEKYSFLPWTGDEKPGRMPRWRTHLKIDAAGQLVISFYQDSNTHLVFSTQRNQQYGAPVPKWREPAQEQQQDIFVFVSVFFFFSDASISPDWEGSPCTIAVRASQTLVYRGPTVLFLILLHWELLHSTDRTSAAASSQCGRRAVTRRSSYASLCSTASVPSPPMLLATFLT